MPGNKIYNKVQSVLISKFYSVQAAFRLVRELEYNTTGFIDVPGEEYYKFVQFNPYNTKGARFYKTVESKYRPGISLVIEC